MVRGQGANLARMPGVTLLSLLSSHIAPEPTTHQFIGGEETDR